MEKHFVTFYSPGTFVAEETEKPIASWNVKTAQRMAERITERYGAQPYAFQFTTRSRGPEDLDSKVSKRSALYYIHCTVRTIDEVREAAAPNERILLSNMEGNGWNKVVTTTRGWKWTQPLRKGDVVLDDLPG